MHSQVLSQHHFPITYPRARSSAVGYPQAFTFRGALPAQQHRVCPRSRANTTNGARRVVCQAAAAVEPSRGKLLELDLVPILDTQGLILPDVPPDAQAAVFAIYDSNKKIQYIGFSKDLRNSLRTVFSRRPDKTFFYKAVNLMELDQQAMMDIRTAWYEECGAPPSGNKLTLERTLWQQPVNAGAISERGKLAAAEELSKEMLLKIRSRGCNEEFVPKPEMLKMGLVEFEPVEALSQEEMERLRSEAAALAKTMRVSQVVIDGEVQQFRIVFRKMFPTKGGYMIDVMVQHDNKETQHRVILGKAYYEGIGIEAETAIERTFAFLLSKRLPRHTEGLRELDVFPINYFTVSEVDQNFDDFQDALLAASCSATEIKSEFWRFNRIHDYWHWGEDMDSVQVAFRLD